MADTMGRCGASDDNNSEPLEATELPTDADLWDPEVDFDAGEPPEIEDVGVWLDFGCRRVFHPDHLDGDHGWLGES